MSVALVWICLVIVHVLLFSDSEPQNILAIVFDRFMMISCFLIYPFAADQEKTIFPFIIQFFFWWGFGASMIWLYKKLSRKVI